MSQRRPFCVVVVVAAAILGLGSVEARADRRGSFGQSNIVTDALQKPGRHDPMWGAIQVPTDIDQSRELDYLARGSVAGPGQDR